MNQQKYYCKGCGVEINEYTYSSNRGMCCRCSQYAYYKENERLTADNSKIDEYRGVIDDISEQCRKLETENAKLRHRAEVTEKALYHLAKAFVELKGYEPFEVSQLAKEITIPEFLQKAEREIKEERK